MILGYAGILQQRVHNLRIEVATALGDDLLERSRGWPRAAVRTVVSQRIEIVGDCHEPRLERNLLAPDLVRIAAAVPALVMAARNQLRGSHQRRAAAG